mgnify:FL=1
MNFGFSQTDSEKRFGLTEFDGNNHQRIYRIQVEDYQVLELVQFKDDEFKGVLTHLIWKTTRKEIRKDSIVQKISIPKSTVRKLILKLHENNFETLADCDEIAGCIRGLDGSTTFFESINDEKINSASYWELESDYYYNQNKVDIPEEVLKARKLLLLINREFDLKKQFQNFLARLPRGRYSYSMLIMEIG